METSTQPDNYVNLYRKYRPQKFQDLVGQQRTADSLRNAVSQNKVVHAYLFQGPRGCGKTTAARILAAAVNCLYPEEGEPCGTCEYCDSILNSGSSGASSFTGIVQELNAAVNRGIDEVRSLLQNIDLGVGTRKKIYIIDEVHRLTKDAISALLKPLEEPPPNVVFILATTDPEELLSTITSRTVPLEFRLIQDESLRTLVQDISKREQIELTSDQVDSVVATGNGSARDTISALESANMGIVNDQQSGFLSIASSLVQKNPAEILVSIAEQENNSSLNPRWIVENLIGFWRNALLYQQNTSLITLDDHTGPLIQEAARETPAKVIRNIEDLASTLSSMKYSGSNRVALESCLVKLLVPSSRSQVDGVLSVVEDLQEKVDALIEYCSKTSITQETVTTSHYSNENQESSSNQEPSGLEVFKPRVLPEKEHDQEDLEQDKNTEQDDNSIIPETNDQELARMQELFDEVTSSFNERTRSKLSNASLKLNKGTLYIYTDRNLTERAQNRVENKLGNCVFGLKE